MNDHDNQPQNAAESGNFDDINAQAPPWILLPKLIITVVISTGLVVALFWLEFGELGNFAYGFAIFLAALQILIVVGLRFHNRAEFYAEKPLQNDWIDKFGAWWLMACACGALFGWLVGEFAAFVSVDPFYFHLGKVFLTVFLPFITMLPNVRYVNYKAAYIQVPLLISVTALPMLVGLSSVMWLWARFISSAK